MWLNGFERSAAAGHEKAAEATSVLLHGVSHTQGEVFNTLRLVTFLL